ncbi:Two-component response regulator ORR11 [Zea mays]|uniref:Two-component response regulator ARR16 n=3 Tax=Zea mays TaxID=4577 RepID=A0A1D6HDW6_MAIZE|nr:Two-component response regulator ARR16 [Zea mays]PWZ22083.1 Two-component response regulator ORR11 [Zea mays]
MKKLTGRTIPVPRSRGFTRRTGDLLTDRFLSPFRNRQEARPPRVYISAQHRPKAGQDGGSSESTGESKLQMASVGGAVAGGVGAPTPHVLAVDDSSVDRAIIAAILRSSRFRVTAVESGKRALELLGTESSKLKQIPVVIMSSENVSTRIRRCLEEGAEDFLVKPVRASDVSRVFSRVLR